MRNRSSKHHDPEDVNEIAYRVISEVVGDTLQSQKPEKNPAAVELGRLGGRKGGAARAAKLTAEQRSNIAKRAADARWQRKKDA